MSNVLYACSTNPGKLREFALYSPGSKYRIEPLPGLKEIATPEEEGMSFEENASLKAVYYSNFTSELVFADDSGLEVDALEGKPGVHSARFAGSNATDQANNNLLLSRLTGTAVRTARFVCVIALAHAGRVIQTFHGSVEGTILPEPKGQNGFGYDPLFFYSPFDASFAEVSGEKKFLVSHRGQALRCLLAYLSSSDDSSSTGVR
ncbi:MAG: RdgB/HAM1 family non-canonical purine NTP pyrophosphatase [Acidobacteriota bacterium]|nr:RdgB/HAM1 family non-canonical purine NTP pyrophosphatase [Acidobacteriota bacterium]